MRDFKGKIVFVSGGASGAGLGQAKVVGREGMKVAIGDVRQDALDNAVACPGMSISGMTSMCLSAA